MLSCARKMNCIGMICIFLAFLVDLEASSQDLTNGFICVTDYWHTISCSLKLPATSFRNTSYWLKFQDNYDHSSKCMINNIIVIDKESILKCQNESPGSLVSFRVNSCPLQTAHEYHNCHFDELTTMNNFRVTLHYMENGIETSSLLDAGFIPAQNIKPKAPFNLTLQEANEKSFFWMSGYELHRYRQSLPFKYEFLHYKDGNLSNINDSVRVDDAMIQINKKLDPDTTYTAMVRTAISEKNPNYHGTWSDWSSTVKWRTANTDEPNQAGKIVMGMCLILGVIIFLIFIPAARFKIKEIALVPTPATYFQPLYQNHQGNFQCWVLQSTLQNIHVLEDFSTIDKFSEVITTLQVQDQVEKTVIYPPAQCHPAYVGPSAELWVPCQMPDTCSETSIPFEEFSLFCEELPGKVDELMQSVSVACLHEEVESLKDSALSHEDCEPSEAPVIMHPTPVCFKQDYCTLTDTPTGPIPTFTRQVQLDEIISNE